MMKSDDALLAAWEETLARKLNAPAIFNTRGEVVKTFREIEEHAQAVESKLNSMSPGNVNAIQIGNHEDWPSLLLASLRKELVVLPLDHLLTERERENAMSICSRRGVADWHGPRPSLFKLTSGTTAAPRAICFRSEQLLADCDQICRTMGISDVDLNFGVIPISHSYGFSNLLTPLIARGVPMVMSRDRLPRAMLDDLARTNATVFPGMPVFYQAFSEMENVPDLPHLRLCISAGVPLPVAVARKFREKFNQPIHSFYGSSECGGICYDRDGTVFEQGFIGTPMDGVKLEWLEPEASVSRVRVRSAAVADGYYPEPDEEKLGGGCFVPDDLISETPHGVRIVGRISDIINIAGKKVNPTEVEAELLRCAGVREAVVFGRPSSRRNEEVAACVVAAKEVSEADLLASCRQRLSGWQVPKRIFLIDQIPVNERGKFSRRELAQKFAAR
ncbi:MAG: class I adenylate-forming enzyme family protein [Verrucomicrobiota bacterium]